MKLTFLGAAMMVTGSSYLLEANGKQVLIDCGMFQGSKTIEALNRRPFHFMPNTLDAVILTHAHIDHSGLLPRLCRAGYGGKIYATPVTKELCSIMLPDSAHIQEYDAEIYNRKGKRLGRPELIPLYTIDDAYNCLNQFSPVPYRSEFEVASGIRIVFQDAGHILGSSLLEVYVTEGEETTKLVFSGDLGQPDQPILKDPTYLEHADYVITESTYGNRVHEHYDREERLAEIIRETVERGGNIIIPAFAVGRTQTLLYYLQKLLREKRIPDIPVIIDSPLAIAATSIFLRHSEDYDEEAYELLVASGKGPADWPNLRFTKTAEESKNINTMDQSAVIISASGMADAGRILHHLKHNLWRSDSTVLFVGYQAQGSLGRRIIEGAKRVKIMGEEVAVKAKICNLEGFSAHADQQQLLHWLSSFKEPPAGVFIVHGEINMSEPFAKVVEETIQAPAYIPAYGDAITITGRHYEVKESDIVIVDPVVRQVQSALKDMEEEYREYKQKFETILLKEPAQAGKVLGLISQVRGLMKKFFAK
ncbi:MAG: MBL fold metallo-hydrolase [Sporomusaceae bacterium]|nr:MBL fold metallo-hydrolase [Sporomusaceae bacterium]